MGSEYSDDVTGGDGVMFNLELWRKHDGISWKYWGKLPWKRAAKKWYFNYKLALRKLIVANDFIEETRKVKGRMESDLIEAEATATRRLELLKRSKDYLDDWFTWLEENTAKDNDDFMELLDELAKELADDND